MVTELSEHVSENDINVMTKIPPPFRVTMAAAEEQ